MSSRTVRLLAWGSLAVVCACSVVAAVYTILAWDSPPPANIFGPKGFAILMSLGLGAVGAIVATRRPSNPIGWIFCGSAVLSAIQAIGSAYALWALVDQGGRPAGSTWAAWLDEWTWLPVTGSLGLVAGIFPDGRALSRRWRIALIVGVVGTLISTVLSAIVPELTIYAGRDNPAGVDAEVLLELAPASISLMLALMIAGALSALVRFRRSHGDERQQLKWLAVSASLVALSLTIFGVAGWVQQGLLQASASQAGLDWAENLIVASIIAVPVSMGIGVLKYRLYDIDVVINKAVVYGALAVFITVVYVAIVAGVGAAFGSRSNTLLSAAAAAVVALAFQPARRRAQHLANRFVYGKRATPYEVLSELSSRFAGTYSLEDALPRLARVTAEAVGADRATVWLRGDGALRPAASWPSDEGAVTLPMRGVDLPPFGVRETGFPVRHQGDVLGAVSVEMPASEPLGPAQAKLLGDVATHAGLVLRNVGLLEDLRVSRKRIVTAQDERARALERNIHDGAQQQLVALTVKLRLAQGLVGKDPARSQAMLGELQTETQAAIEDLRDLARGIYPPLLADKGLREAVVAQARKTSLPVRVDAEEIGRYSQEVEAAVYFCTLEALTNASKYAAASSATVRLWHEGATLGFSVSDDGRGFDPGATSYGTGLLGMADRLAAVGGELNVTSRVGEGTMVAGRVPTTELAR